MSSYVLAFCCFIAVTTAAQLSKRDVSHLPLEYLPPVVLPPLPSRHYLPPVEQQAASHLNHQYLPPTRQARPAATTTRTTTTTTTTTSEAPITTTYQPTKLHETIKISNEYLPPVDIKQQIVETTLAPIKETEAHVNTEATEATETAALPVQTITEVLDARTAPVEAAIDEEVPGAVLEEDGYHYRRPAIIPNLGPLPLASLHATGTQNAGAEAGSAANAESAAVTETVAHTTSAAPLTLIHEYLPPLVENQVIAEAPANGEGSVLAEDGYHYRVIRRLKH